MSICALRLLQHVGRRDLRVEHLQALALELAAAGSLQRGGEDCYYSKLLRIILWIGGYN